LIFENVNTPFEVTMSVGSSGGIGYGYAFLDPYFSIDPSSPAGPYSIITSYGVSNELGSGVPEPSTWATMLLGFAGLGFVGYRKSFIRTLLRS
jgi:PEP-CTERM motif